MIARTAIPALALLGLLAAVSRSEEPAPAAAATSSLRFVQPRDQATVLGPSEAEVEMRLPAGVAAVRVSMSVDGRLVGEMTQRPWRFAWDAGDGARGHRLDAEAHLSDGSVLRTSVRTMPLEIQQVERVDLVEVYAIVRDASGAYVKGLERDAFRLFDQGRLQAIDRFSAQQLPLHLAIVLDNSRSMLGSRIEAAKDAATGLLESLEPTDQALVITFSDTVTLAQGLTSSRAKLSAAIERVEAVGGTALYDALWRAAELLEPFEGRKVVALLSDGRDEATNGLEPGSLHTFEEALDRALRAEVTVFAVGIGRALDREMDFHYRRSVASVLEEVSDATGGRAFISVPVRKVRKSFEEVAEDLRNQYFLAYQPSGLERDGSWHEIRVTTTRPGHRVAARRGYYAPRGAGA